jgi:hypothetical protein
VAGTFNMDAGGFELYPGRVTTERFSCPWEDEVTILSLGGHMHDYGASYLITHEVEAGSETLYEVQEWAPAYRFSPLTTGFEDGELIARPGERFATTCTWYNDGGTTLRYPDEMCTTFGVGYPLPDNYYCDSGNIVGGGGATLRGVMMLKVAVPGDGSGDVNVFITNIEPRPGVPPGDGQRFVVEGVDLSEPGAQHPFVIEEIRSNPDPFWITAWMDEDGEGKGPTAGDPFAFLENVVIDEDEEFEVDIVFESLAQ